MPIVLCRIVKAHAVGSISLVYSAHRPRCLGIIMISGHEARVMDAWTSQHIPSDANTSVGNPDISFAGNKVICWARYLAHHQWCRGRLTLLVLTLERGRQPGHGLSIQGPLQERRRRHASATVDLVVPATARVRGGAVLVEGVGGLEDNGSPNGSSCRYLYSPDAYGPCSG